MTEHEQTPATLKDLQGADSAPSSEVKQGGDAEAGGPPSLSVIFVQYDRDKYPQAFERLIVQLQRLRSVAVTLVVVDNRETEISTDWVTSRIVHIGGDNSAWEFSGFDKGVELLKSLQHRTDLYAFVTDAFMAYGEGFLELVDDHVIDFVLKTRTCVGWVDSIMQDYSIFEFWQNCHMRTSFVFMPESVHEKLGQLSYPIDRDLIFSATPTSPFSDQAPLSANFKAFIAAWLTNNIETDYKLDEPWHSRFRVDEENFEFFKMKTLAILREHLLSARMINLEIPCYDLRLVRLFVENWIELDDLAEEEKEQFQWLGWREAEARKKAFNLDWLRLPERIHHGDPVSLEVNGWVKTKPQVSAVSVSLSERRVYSSDCSLERSDGLPGFEIRANLDSLQPGKYSAIWRAQGTTIHKDLGVLEVLPRFDLEVVKRLISDIIYSDNRWPIYLEASFISSEELVEVSVLLDGESQDLRPEVTLADKTPSGLATYQITVNGTLTVKDIQEQYLIEMVACTLSGRTKSYQCYCTARRESRNPYALAVRKIGKYNHDSRSTRVVLRGSIYAADEIESLILQRDGEPLCELHPARAGGMKERPAWLDFDLDCDLPGIPPGASSFQLELHKNGCDRSETLLEWQQIVQAEKPIIRVDRIGAEPLEALFRGDVEQCSYLLSLAGWVENDHLVNYLQLKLDGEVVQTCGLDRLRPEWSPSPRGGLLRHQGFRIQHPIQTTPGEHRVEISARWGNLPIGSWGAELILAEPQYNSFKIISPDLERLQAGQRLPFWFSIKLGGRIESSLDDLLSKLYVNGALVDQQVLSSSNGSFSLRHVPEATGTVSVRVTVESHRKEIFDSGVVESSFVKAALPERAATALERALDAFSIPMEIFSPFSAEELLLLILEDDEALSSKLDVLLSHEDGWSEPSSHLTFSIEDTYADSADSLKVLFATWDVPCWKHSEGAAMASLLRELGSRHSVTIVHTYGPEQTSWMDQIRPFVSRVVSIPRMSLAPSSYEESGESLQRSCLSDFEKAIERELYSGCYDLVNYEQAATHHYVSRGPTPRVLAFHDLPFTDHHSWLVERGQPRDQLIAALGHFIDELHFTAKCLVPETQHLIVAKREDGEALARIAPDASISLNTPGVDSESLQAVEGASSEPRMESTFVFVADEPRWCQVEPIKLLTEEIFPVVKSRHPRARLVVIVGSGLLDDLAPKQAQGVDLVDAGDDIRAHLRTATGFLAPAFAGFSMYREVLEAMACDCPVISTRLGVEGCRAESGQHYLEANHADEFADAICRCIESHELCEDLAEAGRRLVEKKHTWRHSARAREQIWRQAIGQSTESHRDQGTRLKHSEHKPSESLRPNHQLADQQHSSQLLSDRKGLGSHKKTA